MRPSPQPGTKSLQFVCFVRRAAALTCLFLQKPLVRRLFLSFKIIYLTEGGLSNPSIVFIKVFLLIFDQQQHEIIADLTGQSLWTFEPLKECWSLIPRPSKGRGLTLQKKAELCSEVAAQR